MELDGKTAVKPTPFDAHEQVVRKTHEHQTGVGYTAAEYERQEYPKHLTFGEGEDAYTVQVESAEEEAKLRKAAKAEPAGVSVKGK